MGRSAFTCLTDFPLFFLFLFFSFSFSFSLRFLFSRHIKAEARRQQQQQKAHFHNQPDRITGKGSCFSSKSFLEFAVVRTAVPITSSS